MPPDRSHYLVLGVAERATSSEIRVAYLNLARALHPDRLGEGSDAERALAERRMREVNAAYDVLGDTTRRQAYDRDRRTTSAPPRPSSQRTSSPASAPRPPRPAGNPERFDADPSWRDDEGRIRPHPDDEDGVEVTPLVAFLLRRGPLIALLLLAAFLFVATAYAGGGADEDSDPPPAVVTSAPCNSTPITGVSGGSVPLGAC